MSDSMKPTRRGFLEKAVVLTGVIPFMPRLAQGMGLFSVASAKPAAALSSEPASHYRSLSRDEAAFTESMVNVLCPADHLTPNGVTCGLAALLDRELSGDFRDTGRFARVTWEHEDTQPPLNQAQLFKAGMAAANTACQRQLGVPFTQLTAPDAAIFLNDMAAGRVVNTDVALAPWLTDVVYPMLMQASFAESVHDGYGNRVFWKLFGYLGEPTSYALHRDSLTFGPNV